MALRDQPYLPLYVQDVLTDERLIECSAEAHGIYFRLLCILHKQETYGVICLKQKYKQTDKQIFNFAEMFVKQMPFQANQIERSLQELLNEGVIKIEGDELIQKRMKKDGQLSLLRAEVGKKGGSNVTKQYGEPGYLYLMSDGYTKNKIGISVNPLNRLYRLRSDLKLPKHFVIKHSFSVQDMGKSEDFAQEYFSEILDGEWLKGNYSDIEKNFILLEAKMKAKQQANTENENENENEIEIVFDNVMVWPTFDDFWNLYDKKVDKPKVEKLWIKLKQREKEQIMAHIPAYKESEPDKQYRKNPQTYLNSKSYENEIIAKNTTVGTRQASGFAQDLANHVTQQYGNNQGSTGN